MLLIVLEKYLLERAVAVEPIGETATAFERWYWRNVLRPEVETYFFFKSNEDRE